MKLHHILIALGAVLVLAQRAPALALGAPVSTPCARIPKTPMPFVASDDIANFYTGRAPLTSFRVETCFRQQIAEGYENRTEGVTLSCFFAGHGSRVVIATDPLFENVIQEFTVNVPNRGYVEPGFDGVLDFAGASGTYEAVANARLAQTIVPVTEEEEATYRQPFTLYVYVQMLPGSIVCHGAHTAKVDGDGAAFVFEDVNRDGVIAPGGELSANGASVATVIHWNETSIP